MSLAETTLFAIFICLLGAVPHCRTSPSIQVFHITPANKTQRDDILDISSNDNHTSFTLVHVLQNHEHFFASDTELHLLPGIHEVSETFGSIVIRNLNTFAIIGSTCTSEDDDTEPNCGYCEIVCTGNSTMGLAFINIVNVTISNIHIANCGSRTEELLEVFEKFYDFVYTPDWYGWQCSATDLDILNGAFYDIFRACIQYTILSADSNDITVDQTYLEHKNDACFVCIGTYTLELTYSVFSARCLVIVLDNSYPDYYHPDSRYNSTAQSYTVFNSSFMPSHENRTDRNHFGFSMTFYHRKKAVEVTLKAITMQRQNLVFTYKSSRCFDLKYKNWITIDELKITGQKQACFGLKLDIFKTDDTCYTDWKSINTCLLIKNSQFIQSRINIGGRFACYVDEPQFWIVQMWNVSIEKVPCYCEAALSVKCAQLTMAAVTVNESCCAKSALVDLYYTSAAFSDYNYFSQNKRTCISSTHGSIDFHHSIVFENNVANEYSGSIMIIRNSTISVTTKKFLFQNNSGKHCGGIMAREKSKLEFYGHLQFINNRGYDGGVLALYDRSILQYSTDSVADIEFTGNSALHKGGALYIEDEGYTTYDDVGQALQCALWLYGTNTINASAFSMTLVNNTALYSGSAIYGGWLDVCDQAIYPHYFMKFNAPSEDPSVVSSNPSRVCICVSFVPQCNITDYEIAPLYAMGNVLCVVSKMSVLYYVGIIPKLSWVYITWFSECVTDFLLVCGNMSIKMNE